MLDALKETTLYIAAFIEAVSVMVIGLAAIAAMVQIAMLILKHRHTRELVEAARLNLGRWLVFALELLVAADILRTAVAPSWNEIGQLASIILLRVALNYSLEKDIQRSLGSSEESSA